MASALTPEAKTCLFESDDDHDLALKTRSGAGILICVTNPSVVLRCVRSRRLSSEPTPCSLPVTGVRFQSITTAPKRELEAGSSTQGS